MKSNSIFFAILFSITIIFNNCGSTQFEILKTYCRDKEFDIDLNDNIVVILIPVDGCSSCINKSIDFIKNHPQYPYHYILSSVFKRNLNYISGILQLKPDKIFYDFDNTLMMQGLVNRIPKAIFIYEGKIKEFIELSTEDSYRQLNIMISKKIDRKGFPKITIQTVSF